MTIWEGLKEGETFLAEHQIAEASIDAWYLLEFVCRHYYKHPIDRTWYLLHRKEEMADELARDYRILLKKRGSHVPLQHLTGEQEFMGLNFLVNDKVLVPRQDTEILAEEALKELKSGMALLDLCTGSGCILISLAKVCPGITGVGCDISEEALQVAQINAQKNQTNVSFRQGDLFAPVAERYDMIVSNPPYIPTAEIRKLDREVRLFDPIGALDGKEDGLYFYRKIIPESLQYLKNGGFLMVEIGHDQGEAVAGLMWETGFLDVTVVKDLAGLDRVVKARRK